MDADGHKEAAIFSKTTYDILAEQYICGAFSRVCQTNTQGNTTGTINTEILESTNRSALRALVAVVSAIFIPVHTDTKAAEVVSAFQYDGVFVEVQADGTCQLFPQLVSSRSSCGHVYEYNSSATAGSGGAGK